MGSADDLFAGGPAPGSREYEEQAKKFAANSQALGRQYGVLNYAGQYDTSPGVKVDWRDLVDARSQTSDARAQQQQVYDMLEARARGQGRSVAQAQLAQATGNTMAGARSQAASARGGSLAQSSAQRSAMYAGAGAMQQAAGQSATLRAQEQAAAERALADQANTQRAQALQRQQIEQNLGLGVWDRHLTYAGQQAQLKAAKDSNLFGMIGGGLASGAALLTSDERQKTDVRDADRDIEDFLSALAAKRYRYKAGAGEPPGEHFGVMAQDVEDTPVGRTMVRETPKGKALDARPGLGVLLAAMANVHDRVSKLEGGK